MSDGLAWVAIIFLLLLIWGLASRFGELRKELTERDLIEDEEFPGFGARVADWAKRQWMAGDDYALPRPVFQSRPTQNPNDGGMG